ncbi:L,D-transpeptidase [Gordonia crocea]|uniref:L,D-TPase catalytic domain-containing protein n=1 Tax=Gordonia crocea TaxID=589162 RepID=A0A7I9UUN6_9ACTN|nr:Ig-like domain-containing protein [Gordonia crocea]GED96755.1 hypothetical protein nbrc107697_07940 [Gordonia crocea]
MGLAQPTRRTVLAAVGLGVLGAVASACTRSSEKDAGPHKPTVRIDYAAADKPIGAEPINPTAKVTVTVRDGVLNPDVKLLRPDGKVVPGTMAPDRSSFTLDEPLGYGKTYTWSGTATGFDRVSVDLAGKVVTVAPKAIAEMTVNIGDGQTVGIAAPVILKFNRTITDKAAVEKALTVTTEPATEGAWGWLGEDNGSRIHWRPREYYRPGTKVHVEANLYGLDCGDGVYGDSDVTVDFAVGRSQIVKADANSHQIVVVRDGAPIMTLPCSYGGGDLDRNVTRSGTHVVTEKWADFYMTNPAAGYFRIRERWAVRISNNGEFIHANPETVGVQGSSNVTNGCINLSLANAQRYFESAIYGDPVEVTGTRIAMSERDGDIYDWIYSWAQWKQFSAVKHTVPVRSAPATPSGAPKVPPASARPAPAPR